VSASPYARYLSAKRTVDDRALNRHVLDRLRGELAALPAPRVLEVGAGLGTMVARLVEGGLIARGEYVLLDVDGALLADARAWLRAWASGRGLSTTEDDGLRIEGAGVALSVRFREAELGALVAAGMAPADLLVANAVLDLTEVPAILPRLFALAPGGLYWFSINFDGETIFQPEHPEDERLMRLYHRSMDERVRYGRPAGESRTGRHLFGHLRAAGASVLAAGASDWVVHPSNGSYPADEAYFLLQIIDTIEEAMRQYPEVAPAALAGWVETRRRQVERGELFYLAHQLDYLGRCPG
jgi:SAM-dependent methyltransferase